MTWALLAARFIFGGWMLASGLGHFAGFYDLPAGTHPLAVQLMHALVHIGLLDVAMGLQAAAGAFILAGVFVPAALCVQMPIAVCAAYWAAVLERDPLWAALSLAAVALNGLLMLACLDYYRGVLERRPLAIGEA